MRRPRRILALCAALVALALAGCGGGDDDAPGPLDEALSYLPEKAPFAVAIDTDLEGDQVEAVDSLLGKFPLGVDSVEGALEEELAGGEQNVDFEKDVKPLLGNPFVVGATNVASFTDDTEDDDFVAATQVKDTDALDALIDKTGPTEQGEESGATVYEDDGTLFAVKDDMVIFAGSERLLTTALERAGGDEHLDADTFEQGLDGLPGSALARVYADIGAIIASDPDTRDARKVPWVSALETLGLTASAADDGVEMQFNLRTNGEDLSDADLPIAAGDESPGVIERDGEIGFGIRDLAQVVSFGEAAAQAVDPGGFGEYEQAKKTLEDQLGVSVDDDLFGQFSGDLSATVAVDGQLGVRSKLRDPAAFEETLSKLADVLPSFAEGAGFGTVALKRPSGGNDFYALAQADGDAVVFGVIDGSFVLANDAARAGQLVAEQPASVPDAQGAVTMRADAQALAGALLEQLGPALGLGGVEAFGARLFTGPLEDLTGSVQSSTDGLRGRISLAIH
ncbi:MAG TPA: DUF3352 domain-containing protein [Thermoleophilaceae bacterium]|nr:DUF3352 domain-containing protein [Thermoleophilaceae bacterium]